MADAAVQIQPEEPKVEKSQPGEENVAAWVHGRRGSNSIAGYSDHGANHSPKDEPKEGKEAKEAKPKDEKEGKADEKEPKEKDEKAKPPEQKHQERLDKGFAELKRQKKEVSRKERVVQGREAALAEAQREYFSTIELLKKDPYEFMHKHGVSARDVAKRAVAEQETPEQQTLRELKASNEEMRRELEELRNHRQQSAAQSEEQESVTIVKSFIGEHEEDFPLLADEDPAEVMAALKQYYQTQLQPVGQVLDDDTVRDVFAHFESNLRAKAERYAQRLNGKSTGGPAKASPSERGNGAVSKPAKPEAEQAPDLSSTDASVRAAPPRPLTAKDRFERAVAKLRYTE
jgi:hypothetical protein